MLRLLAAWQRRAAFLLRRRAEVDASYLVLCACDGYRVNPTSYTVDKAKIQNHRSLTLCNSGRKRPYSDFSRKEVSKNLGYEISGAECSKPKLRRTAPDVEARQPPRQLMLVFELLFVHHLAHRLWNAIGHTVSFCLTGDRLFREEALHECRASMK